jgi:hypothetical protein
VFGLLCFFTALPKGKEAESIFGALHNGIMERTATVSFIILVTPAVVLCEKGMKETIEGRKHDLGPNPRLGEHSRDT